MPVQDLESRFERLEARDNRIMSMTVSEIVTVYKHDPARLVQILELRESIVKARAEGIA